MIAMTLSDILTVIGGVSSSATTSVRVTGVSTDTRRLESGDLFFALDGDRFRGSDHIGEAFRAGAVAVVTQRLGEAPEGAPQIVVDDSVASLVALARHRRRALRARVVAVTGSNGKTTTKDAIAALLSSTFAVAAAPKSFNNRIGVALSILAADETTDWLVLELGTNAPGEIAELSDLARPDFAVITCVGPSHLERLGDLDGVRREKLSIVTGMDCGKLFVCGDDAFLREGAAALPMMERGLSVETYGLGHDCDRYPESAAFDADHVRLRWRADGPWIEAHLAGRHDLQNLVAAATIACEAGMNDVDVARAASGIRHAPLRHERREREGVEFVLDCYNANLASMRASAEAFRSRSATGRRVGVFGDMLELGAASSRMHRELGAFLATETFDLLVFVGAEIAAAVEGVKEAGGIDEVVHVHDVVSARREVFARVSPGDVVLVKGSRGMALERLLDDDAQFTSTSTSTSKNNSATRNSAPSTEENDLGRIVGSVLS